TTALYYTPAGRSIQGEGITPDALVEAPKDQQVAGALMLSENELSGAFKNPGRLGAAPGAAGNPKQNSSAATHSPPIKAEVIGTPQDAQLRAALDHIDRSIAC